MKQHDFAVGDRIRFSELGRSRLKKARVQTGTVVSTQMLKAGSGSVIVRLDGRKSPSRLHRSYIEPKDSALR